MSSRTRTFIAIQSPDALVKTLSKLQARLGSEIPELRWVDPARIHLTLAFLGDVDHADLSKLCEAVAVATLSHRRFDLLVKGLGVFPGPQRPRVLWAGLVGDALESLKELQSAVVAAVRNVGYPPADDRFHPHLTLGRFKAVRRPKSGRVHSEALSAPVDLDAILNRYQDWVGGTFPIAKVETFSSMPTPEGPLYSSMSSTALGSAKRKGPT
jgi:2'-5' RNA ligase